MLVDGVDGGSGSAIDVALAICTPDDFHKPSHGHMFEAIANLHRKGDPVDLTLVKDELGRRGLLDTVDGKDLVDLLSEAPSRSAVPKYARIVRADADNRRMIGVGDEVAEMGYAGLDPVTAMARATELVESLRTRQAADEAPDPDLQTFVETEGPEYDWIVPGILEKRDRCILTAGEGAGKSTLLGQIAIQGSAGIHPFSLEPITPVRTLIVDLENGDQHLRRKLRPLVIQAGARLQPGMARIVTRPTLDLTDPFDQQWLEGRIRADRPELLLAGPLYKMTSGDPKEEEPARHAAMFLDRLRTGYGFSLLIEAHSPYQNGNSKRPLRPYGASLWSRWPEFGIHLAENGALTHWRGQRDERAWPAVLRRGGEWPWTPADDGREAMWASIVAEVAAAGTRLSERRLAEVTGRSASAVHRAIDGHRAEWEGLLPEPAASLLQGLASPQNSRSEGVQGG